MGKTATHSPASAPSVERTTRIVGCVSETNKRRETTYINFIRINCQMLPQLFKIFLRDRRILLASMVQVGNKGIE